MARKTGRRFLSQHPPQGVPPTVAARLLSPDPATARAGAAAALDPLVERAAAATASATARTRPPPEAPLQPPPQQQRRPTAPTPWSAAMRMDAGGDRPQRHFDPPPDTRRGAVFVLPRGGAWSEGVPGSVHPLAGALDRVSYAGWQLERGPVVVPKVGGREGGRQRAGERKTEKPTHPFLTPTAPRHHPPHLHRHPRRPRLRRGPPGHRARHCF